MKNLVLSAALVAFAAPSFAASFGDLSVSDANMIENLARIATATQSCSSMTLEGMGLFGNLVNAGMNPEDTSSVVEAIMSDDPDVRIDAIAYSALAIALSRKGCIAK